MRPPVLAMACLVVVTAGCGPGGDPSSTADSSPTVSTPSATATSSTGAPVVNSRFPVDAGYQLAIRCIGQGSPTIILEGGGGSGIEESAGLIGPVAEQTKTTTCTYDRAGNGQSDPPSERRRTLDDASADLHDLVDAAGLAPPFVLVGPSAGGTLVVNYAGRYPSQVVGLVLLDVSSPVEYRDLEKEFPGPLGWRNPEHLDYVAGARRLALHLPDLGDTPVRVVTAADGDSSAKDQSFWLDLSSAAEQTTIQGGHDLTSENTSGVVAEIESTLGASQG